MPKYNVFESTNMASTHYAERILDAVADKDIENGTFGYLNGLADGETVVYNFVAGTKDGEQIVVADNPAWDEDTCKLTNQRRDKYVIPAGTRFRVRVVKKGDDFATAIEGVTEGTRDAMKKDAFVTIDATTGKLVADASAKSGAKFEGVVQNERVVGGTISTNVRNYGYATKLYEVKVKTLA